ncbi:M3 family metallopeptidase [Myroides sp. LJL115]
MNAKKAVLSVFAGASLLSVSCQKDKDNNQESQNWDSSNAFFQEKSNLPYGTADFDNIKNKDFKPALLEGMRRQQEAINAIATNPEPPTFDNTIVAMEKSSELLDRVSAVYFLLIGAHTNDELKQINSELSPVFAQHSDAIYLNDPLFQRIKVLYDNQDNLDLNQEQQRLLEVYYQGFEIAGANLNEEQKEQLKVINQELATLTNTFSDQLLAATKQGGVSFTKEELKGLSDAQLESIKQPDGTYLIDLNNTTQQPDLAVLEDPQTRRKLYDQAWQRAEKQDDKNNTTKTIAQIAKKRAQKAKLMGYDNYAEWSLQTSMAKNPTNAIALLEKMSPYAVQSANEEAAELQAYMNKVQNHSALQPNELKTAVNAQQDPFTLTPADWEYYSSKIRKEKYDLDQNEIKPYFEFNSVLENGVFHMATELYGITFKERKDIPVWQEDVKVYEIFNEDGTPVGLFYTDYYQRDSKRGGAWMSSIVTQSKLLNNLPVIYNVGNFQKPAPGQPALLSLDNVVTVFHEFGHALHGFFSDQTYPKLSGTRVSRDFVELPSQFHEHFAFDPAILKNYAKHYETGEVIPQELLVKIENARNFNKGYNLSEVLGASLLDLEWHTLPEDATVEDVQEFEKQALAKYGLDIEQVPPRYRSSYFNHIFGGGYAAGYYSYKWAEVLDNDAYQWLLENGGITRENGDYFREKILSKGNSKSGDVLYQEFRGKEPSMDAYLKNSGFTVK